MCGVQRIFGLANANQFTRGHDVLSSRSSRLAFFVKRSIHQNPVFRVLTRAIETLVVDFLVWTERTVERERTRQAFNRHAVIIFPAILPRENSQVAFLGLGDSANPLRIGVSPFESALHAFGNLKLDEDRRDRSLAAKFSVHKEELLRGPLVPGLDGNCVGVVTNQRTVADEVSSV